MTEDATPPADIVLEHVKRIQGDLGYLKRDARDLKASNGMILGIIGEMVKATARSEERNANLEVRIERI